MDFENELAKNEVFFDHDFRTDRNMKHCSGKKAIKEIMDSDDEEIFRIECYFNGLICWQNEDRSKSVSVCFKDLSLLNLQTYTRLKDIGACLKINYKNIIIEESDISTADPFTSDLF